MRCIDADALEELFREVIGGIAKKPEMDWNLKHMVRASAMVIEMIQDATTIEPQRKKGMWIPVTNGRGGFECDQCHNYAPSYQDGVEWLSGFCPNCGADMRTPVEIARNIVHKVIDNSVWSDTVDITKMHKVVDDKYAEIRGDANVDAES